MKQWHEAPYNVTGLEYNHVPVNTLGIKQGIQGSIQAPIVAYQPQTYSNIVTTLNVKVIQDKSRLSAVAMLINTETGRIVNAAKANILPHGSTSVQSVAVPQQQAGQLYDLQGRPVSTPTAKGIYIKDHKKIIIK